MGKTRKKRVEGSGKRVTANYKDWLCMKMMFLPLWGEKKYKKAEEKFSMQSSSLALVNA